MGEQSKIAWTRSTVNVWRGCQKVSTGCANCYAEVATPQRVSRARGLELWGRDAARAETKDWARNLRRWNREAVASGEFWSVFGQSMSDTFEARADLDPLRARFFAAIEAAPALTFQLLTKRPENILRMVPPAWLDRWPAHVWIGCTTENQETADERIPHLLRVPAAVRFLSVEPQVGPVDLRPWLGVGCRMSTPGYLLGSHDRRTCVNPEHQDHGVAWVICGGESGSKARPFDLAWARSLRDQCRAAGVPYFLKQLGAYPVDGDGEEGGDPTTGRLAFSDSHGANESEWPADLQGRRAFAVSP